MPGEQTLILLKPDAVQRDLIGALLARFEQAGFSIDHLATVEPTTSLLEQHYQEHVDKDFFPGLREYMQQDHVVACIISRDNAVTAARQVIGDTEPASAQPGTIRGDYGDDSYEQADAQDRGLHNLVHASENKQVAKREIQLWFDDQGAEARK